MTYPRSRESTLIHFLPPGFHNAVVERFHGVTVAIKREPSSLPLQGETIAPISTDKEMASGTNVKNIAHCNAAPIRQQEYAQKLARLQIGRVNRLAGRGEGRHGFARG